MAKKAHLFSVSAGSSSRCLQYGDPGASGVEGQGGLAPPIGACNE